MTLPDGVSLILGDLEYGNGESVGEIYRDAWYFVSHVSCFSQPYRYPCRPKVINNVICILVPALQGCQCQAHVPPISWICPSLSRDGD